MPSHYRLLTNGATIDCKVAVGKVCATTDGDFAPPAMANANTDWRWLSCDGMQNRPAPGGGHLEESMPALSYLPELAWSFW